MGQKTDPENIPYIAARARRPGPACYVLPPQIGNQKLDPTMRRWPSFSFGKKLSASFIKPTISPGPVYQIDSYLTRRGIESQPSYIMAPRRDRMPRATSPGPAHYHDINRSGSEKPAFSFGIKGAGIKRSYSPAPNTYNIKTTIGRDTPSLQRCPAFSIFSRSLIGGFAEDRARTPGPCAYNVEGNDYSYPKIPSYSILGRNFRPSSAPNAPPPGSHCPERCTVVYKKIPSVSFGIKHSAYIAPVMFKNNDNKL